MVLSLIRPTEGDVHLFGHSLRSERSAALRRVGGIVERPDFYLYLSAIRNLELVGALTGGVHRHRIDEVLDLVGLLSRGRDLVKTYSHGMKQRLGIAQALLTDPELVVLDEPTNGLDPQGMKEVRELIRSLAHDRQKTIILSSHLLHEVELVANRMAIIHQGELAVQGSVKELLEGAGSAVMVGASPLRTAAAVCRRHRAVRSVEVNEADLRVAIDTKAVPHLVASLVRAKVRVTMVRPVRSLEEYFLSITEQAQGT
jgi:ABC-2 type transport system ATP-binding protein